MTNSQQKTTSTVEGSEQSIQEEAKRSFFISLTLDILYTLLRISLIIALFALTKQVALIPLRQMDGFQRMQQNIALWQKQIIIDLQVTNTVNCPEKYQQYTSYNWPGVIEGCVCSTRIGLWNYDIVFKGACGLQQFQRNCLSVPQRNSFPYTFWKPSKHLCVKRLQNYNFYSSFNDIVNPNSYPLKTCSPSTEYEIDLISIIDCPITTISNQTTLSNNLSQINFSFEREDNYPIIDFKIAEDNFCENFNEDSITPERKSNYVLEKRVRKECSAIDPRTVLVDQQDQLSFLNNNPRVHEIINQLPNYPPPSPAYTYKLGYLRYPPWNYSCRTSQTFNLLTTTSYLNLQQFNSTFTSCSTISYVILSLELLYIIYYWLNLYLYLKQKYKQGYLYMKDYQIKNIHPHSNIGRDHTNELIKLLAAQLFGVVLLIIFAITYSTASSIQDWFKDASNCTSEQMASHLKVYQNFFGYILTTAIASVFTTLSLIILDLLHFLWRKWKGDLSTEQDNTLMRKQMSEVLTEYKVHNLNTSSAQITQQCLAAHQESPFKTLDPTQDKLLLELQHPNSPLEFSQSCYSENSSNKSD